MMRKLTNEASWRQGSKESPRLDHGRGKIRSMYVIPVCPKGFATLIRAMKKLDLKCRHHWVPNNLLVQSNAATLTARIKFGGSHSSHPECPGASLRADLSGQPRPPSTIADRTRPLP